MNLRYHPLFSKGNWEVKDRAITVLYYFHQRFCLRPAIHPCLYKRKIFFYKQQAYY